MGSMRTAKRPSELGLNQYDIARLTTALQHVTDARLFQRVQAVLWIAQGATVSEVAELTGVSGQTIYNWLQAEEPPALQARTRTRLAEIADVSRKWSQRCPRPAGKLAATLDLGGGTLLDLLVQTPLDEAALRSAMDVLAEYIEDARARRHKRVRGLEPPPETSDDRILRAATGIPLNTAPDED